MSAESLNYFKKKGAGMAGICYNETGLKEEQIIACGAVHTEREGM